MTYRPRQVSAGRHRTLTFAITATAALIVSTTAARAQQPAPDPGIHKIKHVIVIMQENRSFDHYFGTFPGAEGIPHARRPAHRL